MPLVYERSLLGECIVYKGDWMTYAEAVEGDIWMTSAQAVKGDHYNFKTKQKAVKRFIESQPSLNHKDFALKKRGWRDKNKKNKKKQQQCELWQRLAFRHRLLKQDARRVSWLRSDLLGRQASGREHTNARLLKRALEEKMGVKDAVYQHQCDIKDVAVKAIQAAWRGHLVRRQVNENRREIWRGLCDKAAASVIQDAWCNHRTRQCRRYIRQMIQAFKLVLWLAVAATMEFPVVENPVLLLTHIALALLAELVLI